MRDGREIQGEPFSSLRNKVSYYQICKRTHLGFYKMATRLCFTAFLQKPRICNFKCLEVFSEKAMAPHSSTLAWKIPWMEEPGELQSMGSLRVGHDWETSLSLFTFHFPALEKEMATHSSILAWRIPGTVEPGGLLSMGSHRVRHDWSGLAVSRRSSTGWLIGHQNKYTYETLIWQKQVFH